MLREAAKAALARESLLDFAARVSPKFEAPPHIVAMADKLEKLEKLERNELNRVMINLPPRHGKSRLCSQIFAAWYLGRNPDRRVIIATHGAGLSETNSRAVRAIIADRECWPFGARLSSDSTAVDNWNLLGTGGLLAVGVEGSITGRGAALLILDDANHDAGTDLEQRKVIEWFEKIAVPRLDPPYAMLCIGSRFPEGDIFGRILESQYGQNWDVLRLPALAEADDPLGREVDAPLWSARIPAKALKDLRVMMGRSFEPQFMQNPMPAAGNLFKAEWLVHRYDRVPDDLSIIMGLDAESKTGVSNDYSAIAVVGSDKAHHYVLDVIRRKVDFPGLRRMVLDAYERYRPKTIYVEDAANAVGLIQELKQETQLPIVAETAKGSKLSRMEAQTGTCQAVWYRTLV